MTNQNQPKVGSLFGTILSSEWGKLNKHLLAKFFEVEKTGNKWGQKPGSPIVVAAVTDMQIEGTQNWHSPFEQTDADSRYPATLAMLQSGAGQAATGLAADVLEFFGFEKRTAVDVRNESNQYLRQFEGRTGMTKLNSTQVFTGMAPLKFTGQLLFRAWKDPVREVEDPFNQLWSWFLPEELSDDGSLAVRALSSLSNDRSYVETIMPSKTPSKIGMTYKGYTYLPLVIESLTHPIDAQVTRDGKYVELNPQISMGSLTAVDRKDWAAMAWNGG